jgi:Ca-activated chloride channel homolog
MRTFHIFLWLCLLIPSGLNAQFTIYGTIWDEAGDPIIGATIALKGSTQGGITDYKGQFVLKNIPSVGVLSISYTGYAPLEQPYQKKVDSDTLRLNITLRDGAVELSEVVVIGYGVQQKHYTTGGSSSSIVKARKGKGKNRAPKVKKPPFPKGYAKATRKARKQALRLAKARRDSIFPEGTPTNYSVIEENPFQDVRGHALSTFSIDVDAASYANIRRMLKEGKLPPRDAVRIEELINYFDYDYTGPKDGHPFAAHTELGACPWNTEHQLLMIGLQGRKVDTEQLPPANFVFLVDVSGSMQSEDKLPLVRQTLRLLVDQLRPQDRVAIAVYAAAAGLVLPSTSGTEKPKILEAIGRLEAGGSTAGAAGILLAYQTARENFIENGNNRIVLCTDGDFNVGISSDAELVGLIEKERESGVFLTVLGYGTGNYQDSKMQQLADKGNGNHAYIDQLGEARKVLMTEFGGTLFTIAKDVKLQIEFNPAQVAGYRLVGYENRLLNAEDFDNDAKDAGELGAGHRVTALYEIIPAGKPLPANTAATPLRYQQIQPTAQTLSGELAVLKLRYKKPRPGAKSQLMEVVIPSAVNAEPGPNFQLASAAAGFGLLLRQSAYKGSAVYPQMAALARQSATAHDPNGYRTELLSLISLSEQLALKR